MKIDVDLDIPTHKEIYMISYLTLKNWTPDYSAEYWTKEGFERFVDAADCSGYLVNQVMSNLYLLEDAFDAEQEKNEKL